MRKREPSSRIADFNEVVLGYTKEEAIEEAKRCLKCKKPPCVLKCPIQTDIVGYISAIADANFQNALSILLDKNPLPAVCGRVCPHPCEKGCVLSKKTDPIAIAFLKRAAAEFGNDIPIVKSQPTGKKVAIIGAGPAGLTCAFFLAKYGHSVKIFEALSIPGGMLAIGIPSYRLPKDALSNDINRILKLGVEIEYNTKIDAEEFEKIRSAYNAVFIGCGTQLPVELNIPGENLEGVVHAVNYLKDINLGKRTALGEKVAVIGGGNVAIDVVRTALRTGSKKAFILYRRSRTEMPASESEIEEAEEEGVEIHYLAAPKKIIGEKKVTEIECIKMQLGEPDASGRRRPIPVEGSEFKLKVDSVIPAISQRADLSFIPPTCNIELSKWKTINVSSQHSCTSVNGIFAAGDIVLGPATVIDAIAGGRKAAEGINLYLSK
jgi:glutamate synthase (NADPH/NADH) small chain